MKRLYVLMMAALLLAGLGSATGMAETAVSVLDIDPGVQVIGVGGAGTALAQGAETLYYNSAGLSDLSGISFSSFYASYLGSASYSSLALTFHNWGIGMLMFNASNIAGYNSDGDPTDALSYGNNALLLGFGIDPKDLSFVPALPIDFSLGARIKYLSVTNGTVSGSGFSFDLAYRMTFRDMRIGPISLSDMALGVTANNLFGGLNYDAYGDSMAMSLRLGGAVKVVDAVLLTSDLDLGGRFHFGAAYSPIQTLVLRAGMMTQPGGMSITLGMGLNIQGFILDYAYITHPTLAGTHRVALSIDFSGLDLSGLSRSLRRLLP
ncbi:MAG: hypothetical protein DRH06_07810 [Deltaproteobacteria bacterium]|nr:MAG: hypothetical protein DRH06_07810 [Deltaproteobacteria bacterium]